MKQIQIDQQFGQIGINITPPNMQLKITPPDIALDVKPADLRVRVEQPEVIIDLRESFNTMGLQDSLTLSRSIAGEARQTVARGIERRVSEGEALGDPHSDSVGRVLSASIANAKPKKELVLGLMPEAPPKISARLGKLKGEYTPGQVNVRLNNADVVNQFTWGRVDVYMEREPYIDIRV